MLYGFLKVYVRIILRFFIRDIQVNGIENIPRDRAVMFASFHPNSFLDAILLDCLVERPIWSLARGDAFKRAWVRDLLHKLYMMPIYRISEGKENLDKNDETFEKCASVFRKKGQVLIFSEGLCINQTGLLPLKKGTARLALQTWNEGIDMVVIPTALNYNQFTRIGKKIVLNFSPAIRKEDLDNHEVSGANVVRFNQRLKEKLEKAVTRNFAFRSWRPALYYLAFLFNFPLYLLLGTVVRSKTKGTVFFDSVYLAALVFALPFYWLLVFAALMFFF